MKGPTYSLPVIPQDVDQQQGFAVTKWFFDQMITNNVPWLNVSFRSVNPPDYVPIGQYFMGRVEMDKMKAQGKKELFLYHTNSFRPIAKDIPVTYDWLKNCVPCETFGFAKYLWIEPGEEIGPTQDHNFKGNTVFDLIEDDLPMHTAMKMPGRDCRLIMEDGSEIGYVEGMTLLLNPKQKYTIKNTGNTEACLIIKTARLGIQFQRFCDMVARSYWVQANQDKKEGDGQSR